MPRVKDTGGKPPKRPIERYEHQDKKGIQNVASVGMLSEGWDAKTVTHIMGLRASPRSSFAGT